VEALMTHPFPGNVRELENMVEQAAALAEGDDLLPEDFPLRRPVLASEAPTPRGGTALSGDGASTPSPDGGFTLADAVLDAERRAILAALDRHPKDLGRVADELAVSPTTLWRKMKRLGLRVGTAPGTSSIDSPLAIPPDRKS
jgi:two-component system response regulator HydG